ncbi:MAG: hypothetical protein FWD97_04815 [Defluviitaleaceae bacterium]|nr:hypothetical protein [Defluviitaleaceae bacterium]
MGNRTVLLMLKLDGLTTKLEYRDGELFRASTRGDGYEGEEITHNVRTFLDVPLKIPHKGNLTVVGETYMLDEDFKYIQSTTVGSDGKPYKNSRNLAAGSARLLDASECAKRRIRFIAFGVQNRDLLLGESADNISGINGVDVVNGVNGVNVTSNIGATSINSNSGTEKNVVYFTTDTDPIDTFASVDTNSKDSMLLHLQKLGFKVAYYHKIETKDVRVEDAIDADRPNNHPNISYIVKHLQSYAKKTGFPIDGLVITYDDVAYSASLGRTGHHYRDSLALKFEDGMTETILRNVEWGVSRSGELSPVAIFDTVELDGTEVGRASLHNLKFIEGLRLKIGDRIAVSKRNMIIPHVEMNLDAEKFASVDDCKILSDATDAGLDNTTSKCVSMLSPEQTPMANPIIPTQCPCCSSVLITVHNADGEPALFCRNLQCFDRRLRGFEHFVAKKVMNITGLSVATLKKFMEAGLLVEKADIYDLHNHEVAITSMDGFGKKAFGRLMSAIEASRTTTMERFIISMDIPMVGRHASSILCKAFGYDLEAIRVAATAVIGELNYFDFTTLDDFGDTLDRNIREWFGQVDNLRHWERLLGVVTFKTPQSQSLNTTPKPQQTLEVYSRKTEVTGLQVDLFSQSLSNDTPNIAGIATTDNQSDNNPSNDNGYKESFLTSNSFDNGLHNENTAGNVLLNDEASGSVHSIDNSSNNATKPFIGKTIVATGSFKNFNRDTINSQIEMLGAKAGSGVSKKTDYVVAGEKAGGKRAKAESFGIPVLTEAEFMEMAGI